MKGTNWYFSLRRRFDQFIGSRAKSTRDVGQLWLAKDGDVFPFRIRISKPLYAGTIPKDDFVPRISFMSVVDKWGGTIQGASGVFNDRLTEKDVDFIKSRLVRVAERARRSHGDPQGC